VTDTSTDFAELRRKHALHNEEVCKYLIERQDEFGDWVVTTAFYSALHWVCYHLFPRTEENGETSEVINNIDQYCNFAYGRRMSKHDATIELLKEVCPDIAKRYSSLYENCMSARYRDFDVSQKIIAKSKKNLSLIREFCDSPKNTAATDI